MHIRSDLGFEEIWNYLKGCYKSLCVRCIAINENDRWKNVMITGFLSKRDEDSIRGDAERSYQMLSEIGVTELEDLALTYTVQNAETLPNLIKEVLSGQVTMGNNPIVLREGYDRQRLYGYPRLIPEGEFAEYPVISYEVISSESIGSLSGKVYEELKSFGIMSGVDEIGLSWLRLSNVSAYSANVIIELPVYFKPLGLALDGRKVLLRMKAHKALAPKLSLVVALRRIIGDTQITVENARFKTLPTHPYDEEFVLSEANYEFKTQLDPTDCLIYSVTGRLGTFAQESTSIDNLLRKRMRAGFPKLLTQFVSLEELESLLIGKRLVTKTPVERPDTSFHRAIAWLLSSLGFTITELGDTNYGKVRERAGPEREADLLAQDPESERMFVVQCTITPPNPSKIDKIANLSAFIQRSDVFAEPLIFVKDPAGEVKRNARRVRVMDQEDVAGILDKLRMDKLKEAKEVILKPPI